MAGCRGASAPLPQLRPATFDQESAQLYPVGTHRYVAGRRRPQRWTNVAWQSSLVVPRWCAGKGCGACAWVAARGEMFVHTCHVCERDALPSLWLRACHAAQHSRWRMRSPPGCPAHARVRTYTDVRGESGVSFFALSLRVCACVVVIGARCVGVSRVCRDRKRGRLVRWRGRGRRARVVASTRRGRSVFVSE